jgi:short-subunit dehydrogenase
VRSFAQQQQQELQRTKQRLRVLVNNAGAEPASNKSRLVSTNTACQLVCLAVAVLTASCSVCLGEQRYAACALPASRHLRSASQISREAGIFSF